MTMQVETRPLDADARRGTFVLVVHGGAGITRAELSSLREAEAREALRAAMRAGHEVLASGGSSLDAVVAAVRVLEDAPVFNAGRGSVLNHEGVVEMDASIMEGRTLGAGAVAGVRRVRNPVRAARLVLERSPHVLLIGEGAEAYAAERGLEMVDNSYFITEARREELSRVRERERAATGMPVRPREATGTVGAVALDLAGNLAAATSTGGMVNKRFGRVGDSPIIGAGTYADNRTCAVSCTGHGEYFIRGVVAHDIAARMEYAGDALERAAGEVVLVKLRSRGGSGGVIAVDALGRAALPFNTEGMFRGVIRPDGIPREAIFAD